VSNHRFVHVHPHARVTARNARAHALHIHMHESLTVTGTAVWLTAPGAADERRDGSLSPWAAPVTGTPGWQITTPSRRLAVAVTVALTVGTIRSHENGEWQARLPDAALAVMALDADAATLRCRLSARPSLGVFTLTFAPWPAAMVLRCPLTALPAQGRLSVRDVRVTTRMGRTVRYLIPAYTPC
jgi:hypothetical protein